MGHVIHAVFVMICHGITLCPPKAGVPTKEISNNNISHWPPIISQLPVSQGGWRKTQIRPHLLSQCNVALGMWKHLAALVNSRATPQIMWKLQWEDATEVTLAILPTCLLVVLICHYQCL